MFENIVNNIYDAVDHVYPKVYQCCECGILQAPFLYNANIVRNFGWEDTPKGWVCGRCQGDPPQSDEELFQRMEENKHHNLVIKNRVLRSQYGKKYKRIFAKCY